MSRSSSARLIAVAAAAAAAVVAAPARAAAPWLTLPVVQLRLPEASLELPVATLDRSVEVTASQVTLRSDVLFAFGSARLSRKARSRIAVAADAVRGAKVERIRVVGHTDGVGTAASNQALSIRRAEAVARALDAALDSDSFVLDVSGRGETEPVAAETQNGIDDPRGRAKNRRVDVRFR